jgi:predicted MFS family arabinose efflux permease
MSTVFTIAAVCSALSGALYDAFGWTAVTIFAAALPLAGLLIWATGHTQVPVGRTPVRTATTSPR